MHTRCAIKTNNGSRSQQKIVGTAHASDVSSKALRTPVCATANQQFETWRNEQ
jgi:hypothetical protein